VEPGPSVQGKVPLISWVQAFAFYVSGIFPLPGEQEQMMDCPTEHGLRTHALIVRNPSMEPRFTSGEIIMVDPSANAVSGRFVIAMKSGSSDATFRQLVTDGGDTYLKALNPQWPEPIIKIDKDWTICGVVICKVELL
jgi:SOS-response transcriptional repressor LexA